MAELIWHKLTVDETAEKLKTNLDKGLTSKEAAARLAENGLNELTEKKGKPVFSLVLEQFNDFMIWVLIVAAIISAFIPGGEKLDAVVILLIVILNAILGFVQTFRAEKAMQALKELTAPTATVLRQNAVEIPAKEIVPGDVLLLESGDKIPADCRLVESSNLATLEAALTGESGAVSKKTGPMEKALSLGDQKNMVFTGTSVARGRGKAIVVSIGDRTELGKIANLVQQPDEKTPLQIELKKTGFTIALAVIAIAVVVFFVGLAKGILPPVIFLASVSLAVAAIPEGLPAVITVTLALGVQNMAKKNAIVRRLHAVETLGATNYICSDKTGTITLNKMEVKRVYVSGKLMNFKKGKIIGTEKEIPDEVSLLMTTATLANDVRLGIEGVFIGDPTEVSLAEAAYQAGFSKATLEQEYIRIDEIPFESERKMMTSVNKAGNDIFILCKGAPEVILEKCNKKIESSKISNVTENEKSKLRILSSDLASEGYRVLAYAYKESKDEYNLKDAEKDLVFIGFTGMIDPPREEIKASLAEAIGAGINVSMITGDHASTATSIASEIGLLNNRKVLTGADLEEMSTEELAAIVEDVAVYARVNPIHKVKIVGALKQRGHIVAMTGDGVNDAPALKSADIGVAMGITGTDVSKEASDMILSNDNFATIISAVKEGRVIFDNLKKFINFLISCNVSEVLTMFIGTILIPGGQIPLLPIQILWINLVTDGMPALALGMDPPEPNIMKRKPRTQDDGILSKKRLRLISVEGVLLTTGALGIFITGFVIFDMPLRLVQTMTFTALVVSQLIHSLNYRFFNKSVFNKMTFENRLLTYAILGSLTLQLLVIYVPFLQPVFKTTALGVSEWLIIALVILAVEIAIDRVKLALA